MTAIGCDAPQPTRLAGLTGVAPMLAFNSWAFGSPTRLAYEGWESDDAAAAAPFGGQFESVLPDPHVVLAFCSSRLRASGPRRAPSSAPSCCFAVASARSQCSCSGSRLRTSSITPCC